MNCKHIKELIIEYADGMLSKEDAHAVEEHLSSCKECQSEYENMKSMLSILDDFEMENPSPALKKNFDNMISSYSLGMNDTKASWHNRIGDWLESWWPRRPLVQLITTAVVLIIGLVTGFSINEKTGSNKEMVQIKSDMNNLQRVVMRSLLDQSSAADRISGLSMSGRLKNTNREFYSTLLLLLNSDPNVNVRLAAVNALSNFAENDYVRHELVISLGLQSSPLIQISLIDLLASIKETDSSSTLIRMINNPDVNSHVKERARKALKQFI